MPIERVPLDDDRDAWLATRRNFINASEMATVCGEASLWIARRALRREEGPASAARRQRRAAPRPLGRSGRLPGTFRHISGLAYPPRQGALHRPRAPHCGNTGRLRRGAGSARPRADRDKGRRARRVSRQVARRSRSPMDGPATVPTNFLIQVTATRMLNPHCQWAVIAVLINGEFDWQLPLVRCRARSRS